MVESPTTVHHNYAINGASVSKTSNYDELIYLFYGNDILETDAPNSYILKSFIRTLL